MDYTIRGKEIQAIEREVWSLAERNLWEPETFDVLDKYIVPGKMFIDIGAWCGILSLYAEKLGAEVHAIEPDPVAFEELTENIFENEHSIRIYKAAIASWLGEGGIFNTAENGFGNSESSLIYLSEQSKATFRIFCFTLEKFIAWNRINPSNICLIKMDVEGAEVMILKQAAEWLAKHKPPMWISFHPGYFEDLVRDPRMLTSILFPWYNCVGYNAQEFIDILRNPSGFHSFLFLPK